MSGQEEKSTEAAMREIRGRSRRKVSFQEKTRIVFDGLRGERRVSELYRQEQRMVSNLSYRWSRLFSSRARTSAITGP